MIATTARVVFDTNVLVSAALRKGSIPSQALRVALRKGILLRSTATLLEVEEVLFREKFDRYQSQAARRRFLHLFADVAKEIDVRSKLAMSADPEDDKFLQLAVDGRATFLVTGDDHLLRLHPFRGIEIITPQEYLSSMARH